jgi:hypothetical protein
MFRKLLENWNAKKAVKQVEHHPVLGNVLASLRETVNDTTQGIGKHWSEEGKQKLIIECLTDVEKTILQPNPVQAVRLRATELMIITAQFDVLIMQPPTQHMYLSGELKLKIQELAKVDKGLKEFFYSIDPTPVSFNDMQDAVVFQYWKGHAYLCAYNQARCALNDFHKDLTKDWFRACYLSFCIWQEAAYRQELGMPSVIEGRSPELKAIMFSSWRDRVEEGVAELRLAWEESWESVFEEPSPFTGVEV